MSIPPTAGYWAEVSRITTLSPSFTRFTFTGPQLQYFGTHGPDQRIKILLPLRDGSFTDFGLFSDAGVPMAQWYHEWRLLPAEKQNPMRTYTVKAVRPDAAEVDIDFVLHGVEGPASAWAMGAQVGDKLILVGPNTRSDTPSLGGVEWRPGPARKLLIAGDETAVPAIWNIVAEITERPADERPEAEVFIEVPHQDDALEFPTAPGINITWLGREEHPRGQLLDQAVRAWGSALPKLKQTEELAEPDPNLILWEVVDNTGGEHYSWLAGEAGVITGLRRYLVKELGFDRKTVAFMGYWRAGRAEGQ